MIIQQITNVLQKIKCCHMYTHPTLNMFLKFILFKKIFWISFCFISSICYSFSLSFLLQWKHCVRTKREGSSWILSGYWRANRFYDRWGNGSWRSVILNYHPPQLRVHCFAILRSTPKLLRTPQSGHVISNEVTWNRSRWCWTNSAVLRHPRPEAGASHHNCKQGNNAGKREQTIYI